MHLIVQWSKFVGEEKKSDFYSIYKDRQTLCSAQYFLPLLTCGDSYRTILPISLHFRLLRRVWIKGTRGKLQEVPGDSGDAGSYEVQADKFPKEKKHSNLLPSTHPQKARIKASKGQLNKFSSFFSCFIKNNIPKSLQIS